MQAGSWNHPRYSDPDVAYAENMIQASWYLQKAGNAALSVTCAMEAAKAFKDVAPDRATGRKKLGRASYDPAGLLSCETDSKSCPVIQIAAPPFAIGIPDQELDANSRKNDMAMFLRTLNKKYYDYMTLGWFAQNQLRSAIQGRKAKVTGPDLSQVLEGLQKISATWQDAIDDHVVTAACKDAVGSIMDRNPATGPARAYNGMSYNEKNGTSVYDDWFYRLQWLPQDALDKAASRTDAILYGGQSVFYNILRDLHGVKLVAMWPQKPAGRLIEDGLEDLKKKAIGDTPRYDHVASVVCSALEAAMSRGMRAWVLCQAYKTIAGIPDKESITMFRSAGILSSDPAFMPSDNLWADVAMLSFSTTKSRYCVATDVMENAYPQLVKAEQSLRDWLSDESLLKAVAPDAALSRYDIPVRPGGAKDEKTTEAST